MPAKKINMRLLLPQTLEGPEPLIEFVQHYCDTLPDYLPEKWGRSEPYKDMFDPNNLSVLPSKAQFLGALDAAQRKRMCTDPDYKAELYRNARVSWERFGWKRISKPKMEGIFSPIYRGEVGTVHATTWINAALSAPVQAALLHYMQVASVRYGADFAFMDSYHEAYRDFAIASRCKIADSIGFYTHTLRRWLPDVFWGTVFGAPYVRLIGKQKLLTAPAYKVQELGDEMVYVQLSESLSDVHNDFAAMQQRRAKVKAHLDNNIFFNPDMPEGHLYNTPRFEFPDQTPFDPSVP